MRDPSRNLSWILQCNFVGSADSAALVDPRVAAAIAVSPPMRLLFDVDSAGSMKAKVLVISGSRDWVVPPGPEAIEPMARATRGGASGHRLVLAENADHFNLRSPRGEAGGPCGPCCWLGLTPLLAQAKATRLNCPLLVGAVQPIRCGK